MNTPVRSFLLTLRLGSSIATVGLAGAGYTAPWEEIARHGLKSGGGPRIGRSRRLSRQTDFGNVGGDQNIQNVDDSLVSDAAVSPEDDIQVRILLAELDQRCEQLVLVHLDAVEGNLAQI